MDPADLNGMGGSRLQADATPFNPRAAVTATSHSPPPTGASGVGLGSLAVHNHHYHHSPNWGGGAQPAMVGGGVGFVDLGPQFHVSYHQPNAAIHGAAANRFSGAGDWSWRQQHQSSRSSARRGEQEAVTLSGQRVYVLPKAVNADRSTFLQVM
eukprot:CAMPEP_0118966634 /NCGR_PEP_ID=MMETSP1173-20130426/4084_1 /TAXON_ID=1034831 /ORGANISM="Rhizochromulina marina cf, Strain CCMP1243" /LENGTH=153 /DNA_ID=CAMNT_0006915445 /DNA_START=78 /DNA_END=539 /DNA_ORIENTATION=+